MPKATVLKPFAFAADHIKTEDLVAGDVRDFPDDIIPGLVKEGYVEQLAADQSTNDDDGENEGGEGAEDGLGGPGDNSGDVTGAGAADKDEGDAGMGEAAPAETAAPASPAPTEKPAKESPKATGKRGK